MHTRRASQNAAKIVRILKDREGHADIYRTAVSGPSGQRYDALVGSISYTHNGPFEIKIQSDGETAGWAARTDDGNWDITEDLESDGLKWIGTASTLAIGMDVLIHGKHMALGRHDSERTSHGTFSPAPVYSFTS